MAELCSLKIKGMKSEVSKTKEQSMYIETIKNKKSISYRTSITINGAKFNSPFFKRKTDCKDWLAKKRNERLDSNLHGDLIKFHQKILFNEYSELWLKTKSAQGSARSTMQNYERYVRVHFAKHFSGLDLKQVQKSHVEAFQVILRQHHNPKGVNLIITALKGLFREAVKEGYILKSPCEFIRSLASDSAQEVFWTKAEIEQFLKANYDHELYDFFIVALNTACRKGELAGLAFDRVSFQENTITITRTRDGYELKERTKTKMKRVVPMNNLVRATLLKLFYSRQSDSALVFLKKNGEPINPHHIYRQFMQAQKKAKMTNLIRFHDIRHTAASQFVLNGGSIYDLQKILGHTSIVMTQRYAHLSMEHLQSAMNRFSLGEGVVTNNSSLNPDLHYLKSGNLEVVPRNLPETVNG